ncbi:MAG: DUF5666 domain-containing protein [Burkholderiaceae bacterium]
MNRAHTILLAALITLLLPACGPGEGGTGGAMPSNVGAGRVDGFGSAIVEGQRLADANARVSIDEDPTTPVAAPVTALKLGMQVQTVTSNGNLLTASVGAEVIGPIEFIEANESAVVILGQRVVLAGHPVISPVIDGFKSGDFFVGDVAQVHGLRVANGDIVATRMELRPKDKRAYRLAGTVSLLDTSARTFNIGTQRVSYSSAQTAPANGQRVVVFSDQAIAPVAGPTGAVFAAKSLRADRIQAEDGAALNLAGPIANLTNGPAFVLRGVPVVADGAVYPAGQSSALLRTDAWVRVSGVMRAGQLQAQRITVLQTPSDAPIEITGAASDFSSADAAFRLRGATVSITPTTQFVDGSGDNLANGVVVFLRGLIEEGVVVAQRVEFVEPPEAVAGFVTQYNAARGEFLLPPQARIIRVDAATQYRNGSAADLANARRVRVTGSVTAGSVQASEVTFLDAAGTTTDVLLAGVLGDRTGASGFYLNGRIVQFDAATRFIGGATGTSADLTAKEGVVTIVRARTLGTALIAASVEFKPTADPANSAIGYVSQFVSLADLRVAGQRVDASGAAITGGTGNDVRNNVFVLAQVRMSNGVLIASTLEVLRN